MRKIQRFLWVLVALPIILVGCDKPNHVELPPPPGTGTTDNPGTGTEDPGTGTEDPGTGTEDPGGNGGNTQTNPWDANRGVIVTPSGSQWTSTVVREGIVYYYFNGTDEISGQPQKAFAIDLDLSNPKYKVLLTRTSPSDVTSNIHKAHNAIATINAGYEAASIYIRVGGIDYSSIPNTTIGGTATDPDNWKSEGAFYIDHTGTPGIIFVGSPKRDGLIKGIKGLTYAEAVKKQRTYYMSMSKANYPYLISSAPSMIDDFEPLGENFCDYTIPESTANNMNSEELEHHQRVRHPRTAIALTEHNHLILLVVDGRRTSRKGMSCRELTRFMVKWFNPQYALNLDGGGSSTMCVEGLGDSRNVVNSPIDGSVSGQERKRDTHIMIIEN